MIVPPTLAPAARYVRPPLPLSLSPRLWCSLGTCREQAGLLLRTTARYHVRAVTQSSPSPSSSSSKHPTQRPNLKPTAKKKRPTMYLHLLRRSIRCSVSPSQPSCYESSVTPFELKLLFAAKAQDECQNNFLHYDRRCHRPARRYTDRSIYRPLLLWPPTHGRQTERRKLISQDSFGKNAFQVLCDLTPVRPSPPLPSISTPPNLTPSHTAETPQTCATGPCAA